MKNTDLRTRFIRHKQALSTLILLMFFLPVTGWAQNDSIIHSNATLAEKIYLQLDSKVYTTGNTVWFKCIVSSAFDHTPTLLSGVLYVELISSDEKVCERKIIKMNNGIGQGFFDLKENLHEGVYLIRAYTQWNKNFGTDFIFKEYINVFASKDNEVKPISNVTLIKKQNNEYRLEACFNPLTIDSLHKNKLKIHISLDNKKDSFILMRDDDNKYRMDYSIPNNCQLATLQMQTANKQRFSKTILINEAILDLQFFPESGLMVHGLPTKIGFKALDARGKGRVVQGVIVDEHDSVVQTFESNSLGMGSFVINQVDSNKTYFARVVSQSDKKLFSVYPLPHVTPVGNVLSITKEDDKILLTILSNYLKNDSINLRISQRGVNYLFIKVGLDDGFLKLSIPRAKLPDGIVAFTLFDKQMHPVAERLYFNEKPESRMQISLSTDKEAYAKRELTKLDIKTTNSNGEPIKANVSILAINKDQMGKMQGIRQNILSYYLLNSELKGEIENPGFYFGNDSCRQSNLDALMLTQGWRKYLYSAPLDKLTISPEQALTVSGKVTSVFSKKRPKIADLNMIAFGKEKSCYNQTTDSLGKFNFVLCDEYGQDINIVIQCSKKTGENVNYNILMDTKESPPVYFSKENRIFKSDSIALEFVQKNIERKKIDDKFSADNKSILLKEITVKGHNMTKSRKLVWEEYGEPATVIDGKDIRAKEEKWSFGVYSILQFNYPNVVRIKRTRNGFLYAKIEGQDMTLVVIDGIPVYIDDYAYIPSISPSEIRSVEIIKCAKNYPKLFYEVFPPEYKYPAHILCGGVVAIYTYGNKGLFGAVEPVGISKMSIPVFSAPREFYAPKYENVKPDEWKKRDLRALIHWEPVLKTDSTGTAHSTFYNADNTGKMQVVVEAISEKGEIGYQEIDYKVKGK